MSLLSIVASSSAFSLPASPPPKGSSIDSDWSTKNKKQPGFLRLISAWYAMVFPTFLGITRTTTLTCQRSQVGVLSRPSPECSCTSASTPHLTSTRAGVGAWAPAHGGVYYSKL